MTARATLEYIVRVHEEDDGSVWAEVLDLPGCFASGSSLEELREALEEAISLYIADDPEAGMIRRMRNQESDEPRPMSVDEMRVTIPA